MTDESNNSETGADQSTAKIPPDVVLKLKAFNDALTKLEDVLEGHLNSNFEDHLEREPLEMARVDLMSLFSANSLSWSLLALKGQDPKKNEALQMELDRTKKYMGRLKIEESRREQMGVNDKVAKALVRNALFDAQEYSEKKRQRKEEENMNK